MAMWSTVRILFALKMGSYFRSSIGFAMKCVNLLLSEFYGFARNVLRKNRGYVLHLQNMPAIYMVLRNILRIVISVSLIYP